MGVGKQLRQAREARGLTVRDVADLTKISSRQIEAIETEHYEKLPGGIFGRGYVRALALALKLDADALVRAYRDETEADHLGTVDSAQSYDRRPSSGERPPPAAPPWRFETRAPRMRLAPAEPAGPDAKMRVIAAVLIGIGVILAIIWLGRDRSGSPLSREPQRSGAPVASAQPGSAPQPVGTTGRVASAPARGAGSGGTEVRVQA